MLIVVNWITKFALVFGASCEIGKAAVVILDVFYPEEYVQLGRAVTPGFEDVVFTGEIFKC